MCDLPVFPGYCNTTGLGKTATATHPEILSNQNQEGLFRLISQRNLKTQSKTLIEDISKNSSGKTKRKNNFRTKKLLTNSLPFIANITENPGSAYRSHCRADRIRKIFQRERQGNDLCTSPVITDTAKTIHTFLQSNA